MKREKIYNYFYIVNNLLNGHFYLGVHSTDTLADGYKGSGKALKLAIKKHGKENFELVPLKFFKTRKELMDFEREIVNERFLTYYKGICYNLKRGGEGGSEPIFTPGEAAERRRESVRKHYYKPGNKERKREYEKTPKAKSRKREYMREYQRIEKIKDYKKEYYQQNKERICEQHHEYNQQNKERIYEQHQNWRNNNLERSREIHREAARRQREKKKAAKLAAQQPG